MSSTYYRQGNENFTTGQQCIQQLQQLIKLLPSEGNQFTRNKNNLPETKTHKSINIENTINNFIMYF
jgi:predicted PurR-regulated permease PerM